jgi:hypothetical protein
MHYRHVIALAQMQHEQHQEYAQQAARARHNNRRTVRRVPGIHPSPIRRPTGDETAQLNEAVRTAGH